MFRFRFDKVLRVRQIRETMARQVFARAQRQVQEIEENIARHRHEADELEQGLMERMASGLMATELRQCRNYIGYLDDEITALDRRLDEARQVADLRREELLGALKELKIMERLREIEKARYEDSERKRETQFMDEIALRRQRSPQ